VPPPPPEHDPAPWHEADAALLARRPGLARLAPEALAWAEEVYGNLMDLPPEVWPRGAIDGLLGELLRDEGARRGQGRGEAPGPRAGREGEAA
jgi:hypothetical protein